MTVPVVAQAGGGHVGSGTLLGKVMSFLNERLEVDDDDDHRLYDKAKPWARLVKIVGQMLIGLATAVAVIVVLVMRAGFLVNNSKALGANVSGADMLTADVFAITAVGLAAAAALELAYTLYTPGPDEAINPLLLGLSSTFLFLASKTDHLDWQFGFSAVFVVAALFGLFRLQGAFKKRYPGGKVKKVTSGGGPGATDTDLPEETAETRVA